MQKNTSNEHLPAETVSVCPSGESFPLPDEAAYREEHEKLKKIVAAQREKGREIVVVMGVGFVGAVMAGVVADSTRKGTDDPFYPGWAVSL